MGTPSDLKRYRANLQDEIDSAAVYRSMASAEADEHLATVYRRLADVEERHAAMWEAQLERAGAPRRARRPSLRSRVLVLIARCFGAKVLLPTVANMEAVHRRDYDRQPDATPNMRGQERSHARVLRLIAGQSGLEGSSLARIEGRHRNVGGNALRAAVLGANDGLVSNLSLVMGVAGAALSERAILVAGCAGLLAGACSMAMGEWISVQSSRELYARQVGVEQTEIETIPDEEKEELALIYMAKGLPEAEAKRIADRIMADEKTALDAMAREELGIDPEQLGGSPWAAAATSFVLFAAGAIVPLLPFAVSSGRSAFAWSVAVSALALALVGVGITLFTGRSVVYTAVRQLLFGAGAAAVTFAIGRAIGVAVSP